MKLVTVSQVNEVNEYNVISLASLFSNLASFHSLHTHFLPLSPPASFLLFYGRRQKDDLWTIYSQNTVPNILYFRKFSKTFFADVTFRDVSRGSLAVIFRNNVRSVSNVEQ